jgi:hypothetical protein
LLLYVYYKNACKSKSKTSPSTGVQFCFCMSQIIRDVANNIVCHLCMW